jgi:hypothetical protein
MSSKSVAHNVIGCGIVRDARLELFNWKCGASDTKGVERLGKTEDQPGTCLIAVLASLEETRCRPVSGFPADCMPRC